MQDKLPDEYGKHILDDGRTLFCQGKGYRTIYGPYLPEVFSKKGEDQVVDIVPGLGEFFRDFIYFHGESGEVREALAKIVANWPTGVCDTGKFSVEIGVKMQLK